MPSNPYLIYTKEDAEKYSRYLANIEAVPVGFSFNIGGIYKKGAYYSTPKTAVGFLYRIYDKNVTADRRKLSPSEAVIAKRDYEYSEQKGGTARGLVISLVKDAQTGDFFKLKTKKVNENGVEKEVIDLNSLISASPRIAWLAANYTGGVEKIAEAKMEEFQGSLRREYCVHENGRESLLLNGNHIKDKIIKPLLRDYGYRSAVLEEDNKSSHRMESVVYSDSSDEYSAKYQEEGIDFLSSDVSQDQGGETVFVSMREMAELNQMGALEGLAETGEIDTTKLITSLNKIRASKEETSDSGSPVESTGPIEQ